MKVLMFMMLFCACPAVASVQCWVNGAVSLNFGTVGYREPTEAMERLNYACYGAYAQPAQTYHVRLCTFIQSDPAMPGIAPRRLRHWDGSYMQYDFYSDAAHAQLIGAPGGPYPVMGWDTTVSSNGQISGTVPLFGRAPAGQGALSLGTYESHFQGGLMRWRWSRGNAPVPSASECQANVGGEGGGEVSYFVNVTALSQEACFIRLATDLDFGGLRDLDSAHDAQGTVGVQCPLNTAWSLSLSPGLHASGAVRRMQNAQGSTLSYGLFRDAARTQPWGMAQVGNAVTGVGMGVGSVVSVPVYGRVPTQPVDSPGAYSDTVTVTLTY